MIKAKPIKYDIPKIDITKIKQTPVIKRFIQNAYRQMQEMHRP